LARDFGLVYHLEKRRPYFGETVAVDLGVPELGVTVGVKAFMKGSMSTIEALTWNVQF
jgi:hypothetical protein